MPGTPAPSHAYVATVAPFDLQHPSVRAARLSARQVAALNGLPPIPLDLTALSPFDLCMEAELVIQDAVAGVLKGRHVSAVLWRDPALGDVSVWHEGRFLPIAIVELAPVDERAVAA